MSKHQKHTEGEESQTVHAPEPDGHPPSNMTGQIGTSEDTQSVDAMAKEGSGAPNREAELEARIVKLEAENSELKDQYLRKLADYENFRKRMFREREEASLYANAGLLGDLVGVIDNFDRAVHSADGAHDFQALHDGVLMIRQSLLSLLESKYGLKRYDSVGAEFDPNIHEAIMSVQGECSTPVVAEEFMKGYKLHDRIIRTAKVKVCLPLAGSGASGNGEAPHAGEPGGA